MDKSYGINNQASVLSELDHHLEELRINGFTILKNVLNEKQLEEARKRLDALNDEQTKRLSAEYLNKINELNLVRCPFIEDEFFLTILTARRVNEIVEHMLGNYYIVHLQNGIVNKPKEEHHQSSWHRDLPYQNYEISSPLAISALFCIDEFSEQTGGTLVLPFSHRLEKIPSNDYINKFSIVANAPAGSVIVFDSMLLHKAGYNKSENIRRGINNMYVKPILKQQVNIPKALNGKFSDDPDLRKLLGYDSVTPDNVDQWRENRKNKLK